MISEDTADEGAALLSTAIGELAEDLSADALTMTSGDHTVYVMRAESLEAAGVDIATLAKALRVLAQRRGAT